MDFRVAIQPDSLNQQVIPVNRLLPGTVDGQDRVAGWRHAILFRNQVGRTGFLILAGRLQFAAFLLGFFGSLHCVGMCGPWPSSSINRPTERTMSRSWRQPLYHGADQHLCVILGLAIGSLSMALWGQPPLISR